MASLNCRLHLCIDVDLLKKAQSIADKNDLSLAKLLRQWIDNTTLVQLKFAYKSDVAQSVSYNLQLSKESNQKLDKISKYLSIAKNNIIKLIIQHNTQTHVALTVEKSSLQLISEGDSFAVSKVEINTEQTSSENLAILFAHLFHENDLLPAHLKINHHENKKLQNFDAKNEELYHLVKGITSQQSMDLSASYIHLRNAYSLGTFNKSPLHLYTLYYLGIYNVLKGDFQNAKNCFLKIWQQYPQNEYLFERSIFLYRLCISYIEGYVELGDMIYKYNDCSKNLHLLLAQDSREHTSAEFLFGQQTFTVLCTIDQFVNKGINFEELPKKILNPILSLHTNIYKILNTKDAEKNSYQTIIENLHILKDKGCMPDLIDYYIGYLLFTYGDNKQEEKGKILLQNIARYSKIKLLSSRALQVLKEKSLFYV